ncbi:MAG TPA: tetratricopeptide repeat protein [Burkholderiales bacterium]|nr:tetratricopeptide repeat protein [Burkholderiales bacterium]
MGTSLRASLFFGYAQFLSFFGMRARALEFIELTLLTDPKHQRAWTFAGFLQAQRNSYDAAIASFQRAVELRPGDADSLFNLGFALQHVGRHEEAIERFDRAIEANRFLDRAWYGAGISLDKLGRYEAAAERFAEAGKLQPMNPYAAYHRAAMCSKLGRKDEVNSEYERVKGFDPKVAAQMERDFGAGRA